MTLRRGALVAVAAALVIATGCGELLETAAAPPTADAGNGDADRDGGVGDDAAEAAAPDAGDDGCETLKGSIVFPGQPSARAIAADGAHVYWTTAAGIRRGQLDGTGDVEPVDADATVTHLVLSASYVAWRSGDGFIRSKPKTDIAATAGAVYDFGNALGLAPGFSDAVLIVRVPDVYRCPAAPGGCSGTMLAHAGVVGVSAFGSEGLDYLAPAASAASMGVFHCAGDCRDAGAPVLVALAGDSSTKIAGDETTIYWIAPAERAVRRVPRAGGQSETVMSGVPDPTALALDAQGRLVVATAARGLFRGAKTGTCVARPGAAGKPIGLAATSSGVYFTEGDAVKRVTD